MNFVLDLSASRNSEDYTKNNVCWYRLAAQGDAVVVFGRRCESLSVQGNEPYFAGPKLDYEKYKKSKVSSLLNLVYFDFCHQRFEDGLDMTTMATEAPDLAKLDHWNL